MTKRERVLAVLNGEVPDRVPIFEYLIHDGVFDHFGVERIKPRDVEAHIRACATCLDVSHPVSAPGVPGEETLPDGTRKVHNRWDSWEIPAPGKSVESMAELLKKEIEVLEAYRVEPDAVAGWKEKVKRHNECAGDMLYIHSGTSCAFLPGTIEEGIYLYTDYPELVERWINLTNRKTLSWMDAVADAKEAPVVINWNDVAIKGRLLYPPWLLEKLLYPTLSELCDLLHSKGIRMIFHSDGCMWEAMDSLVRCGIDGFNPLETSAGMGIETFKQKYGKKIAIVGGLDAVDVLAYGSVDKVVEETKRYLTIAGKGGGLIAGSASGEIDESMPTENVVAFFETVWEYGCY